MKTIKKFRWIIAFLVLLITTGMVRMALNNVIYLPVVISDATQTPIPSSSQTPTPTATSTSTPTSTPKPSGIEIDEIVQSDQVNFPLNEYVSIHNYTSSAVSLTDWFIRDDGNNRYDFPNGFSISSGGTIKLWTRDGVDTNTELFWGSEVEVWNDVHDCAYLRDDSEGENELIDVYCYSQSANGSIVISRNPSD
jgi:hypothetical protein